MKKGSLQVLGLHGERTKIWCSRRPGKFQEEQQGPRGSQHPMHNSYVPGEWSDGPPRPSLSSKTLQSGHTALKWLEWNHTTWSTERLTHFLARQRMPVPWNCLVRVPVSEETGGERKQLPSGTLVLASKGRTRSHRPPCINNASSHIHQGDELRFSDQTYEAHRKNVLNCITAREIT